MLGFCKSASAEFLALYSFANDSLASIQNYTVLLVSSMSKLEDQSIKLFYHLCTRSTESNGLIPAYALLVTAPG